MWFRVADGRTKCICTPGPIRLGVLVVVCRYRELRESVEPNSLGCGAKNDREHN
jgi:hypothetical protein